MVSFFHVLSRDPSGATQFVCPRSHDPDAMSSLIRMGALRTFVFLVIRPLMSSQLRRDVSGGVGVGASFPEPRSETRTPLADPEACLHAPPLGGRCSSGLSSPSPEIRRLPKLVFVRRPLAWPAQRGWAWGRSSSRGRAGLRLRAGRSRRGHGRGYAGQGLHAGHHSGQLRWCAWRGPMGGWVLRGNEGVDGVYLRVRTRG